MVIRHMAKDNKNLPEGCFRSSKIEDALSTWERGGLVAIPTETVIGLGAPVHREELVKKIFSYKERPFYDPLIVHICSIDQAMNYAKVWNSIEEKLAQKFWPGPLTLVVKKNDEISDLITSGLDTVGLRIPASKKTRDLIEKLGHGVAAPSANKFTKTSPTSLDHVESFFMDKDLCLLEELDPSFKEGYVGIESTIVKVDGNKVSILRPGSITPQDIREALDGLEFTITDGLTAFEEKGKTMVAPGNLPVHYRPSYELLLLEESMLEVSPINADWELVHLDADPVVTARQLYLLMQEELPQGKTKKVFILPTNRTNGPLRNKELWESILNRLEKAGKLLS